MNIALWAIQIILCLIFYMAGRTKAFQYEKAKFSMPWIKEYPKGFVKFIGWAEVFGAAGLILPVILRIPQILMPLSALGLAIIMLLAAGFHFQRKEYSSIPMTIILLLCALFVAIGRFYFVPYN
ncbi:DoxX family protein [Chungangia koreensis]|uniref:DoxX family protein n=1 Tax=Chungangia koreensis TaxID=752657 RepID=A0ABV8X9W5_9LACT